MDEIIKPIAGHEEYSVSNIGGVYSLLRGQLKTRANGSVEIWKAGARMRIQVSELVANAFVSNPNNLPNIAHKDGDKTNNRADNLMYVGRDFFRKDIWEEKQLKAAKKKGIRRTEIENKAKVFIEEALRMELKQTPMLPIWFASKDGKVYYVSSNGILEKSTFTSGRGYLTLRHASRKYLLHRVIALTFLGKPPDGKPLVLHKDDDRMNNHIDNLYFGDYLDNAADRLRNRTTWTSVPRPHIPKKLTMAQVLEMRSKYPEKGYKKLAKEYDVSRSTVRSIIRRLSWNHI